MSKKKKPKQDVVAYGMSIHFGICAGPVEYMWGLIVDEKPAWPTEWPKYLRGLTQIGMSLLDLFGGDKKEGGLEGIVTWLPGDAGQVMPENLAEKFGRTAATMPAYRGIASIFFSGPSHRDLPGFYWRANSPYLPGVWVGVARASEALNVPYARIWRTRIRPSLFMGIPAGGPDDAILTTIKAALAIVLDIVSARIASGEMDIDIAASTYGIGTLHQIYYDHATTADIAALKAWINSRTSSADDMRFYYPALAAHGWFTASVGDTSITKRVFMLFTARYPSVWGGFMTAQEVTDEGKAQIADELARDGGVFNTAANTAVDCYGINIDLTDTQYTAQLDNTPDDGVPVVPGDDPDAMAAVILRALGEGVYDSNPAHIIYECLTNTNWGMGAPASAIDVDGFEAASITLYEENFGLSMMWVQPSSIEDFITEVLDHIEATLFVNPRTGLLTLKLIRNDYSVPSLPVFTPDNSVVTNFSRKLWGETINEIVVTWTNPDNEEEETIVAQDLANIEAQGGVISDGRNYYGVRRPDLAARLAHRDLRSASTPLAKCDIEVNRAAWDLLPGDCCVLDSPEDGIDLIVMRVGPVDYGKPGDSTVRTSLVEDVFSLALADYTEPPESLWVDPSEDPSAADHTKIVTLPYYVLGLLDASILAGVDYPEVFAGVLAAEAGQDTETFELYGQQANAAGVIAYVNFGTKTIASRGTLATALAAEVETTILSFPNRTQGNGPVVGGLMLIEGSGETTSEICLVSDLGVSGYVMTRGVLDTIPRAWPAGTPVWFVDENMAFIDDIDIRAEGETVNYKVLPTTSRGTLAVSSAPVSSAVMTARPHLPLRPADVTVNGDDGFAGSIDCIGVDPIPVTWARRNRETETSIVKSWTDGDVTPETGQTTTVTLTDIAGTVLHTTSGIAGTSHDVDPADFGSEGVGYIVVASERDGLDSLQAYRALVQLVAATPVDVAVTGVSATGFVGSVAVAGLILDGTSPTGAWSMSRDLLASFAGGTRYTTATGVDVLTDQTGVSTRNFTQATAASQPAVTTAGPLSRTCADFDGSNDYFDTAATLGTLFSVSSGYVVVSFIADAVTGSANTIVADTVGVMGLLMRSLNILDAYNDDGTIDTVSTLGLTTGTPHVATWRHEGGNLHVSIDGSPEISAPSGNLGAGYTSFTARIGTTNTVSPSSYGNIKLFEMATFSTVPALATRDAIVADFMAHAGATTTTSADPYIVNTVLLCGFEGVDAATAFLDESQYGRALTAVGNAQIDTAQFRFGASSALFDGTGDAITAADSADWDLSNANSDQFTIETWVRFNSLTGDQTLVSQWVGANLAWHVRKLTTTNQIQFAWSTTLADSFTVVTSGVTLATATWYHIAVDKDSSGKIRIYVDGVMRGSSTPANSAIANSTAPLTIGGETSGSTRVLNGWLDELRITKHVARYASDAGYTVPAAAFPRS